MTLFGSKKRQDRTAQSAAQNTEKTLFVEDSKNIEQLGNANAVQGKNAGEITRNIEKTANANLMPDKNADEITSLEIRLVTIINDLADVHTKLEELTNKILGEIKNVNSGVEKLAEQIKGMPKEAAAEILQVKKVEPEIYEELRKVIGKKVQVTATDIVDARILKIIIETKKIDSLDLLKHVQGSRVCSKNTLFAHLKRLEDMRMIAKSRSGHKVFYSPLNIPETALEVEEPQDKNKETKETVSAAASKSPSDNSYRGVVGA